jgi:hypothetical protein
MKIVIETTLKTDTEKEAFSFAIDKEEIASIANKLGLAGANKAIDSFVEKYTIAFKQKLSAFLNK